MSSALRDNGTYQLITPPNTLKERVGAGTGIDATLAERAGAAVANMQNSFLQKAAMAVEDIAEQAALIDGTARNGSGPGAAIFEISRDMQMRGAAFGYPMVSDVFGSLCGYIENLKQPGVLDIVIIEAHTDAVRSVIANEIEDDGGSVGQQVVASLNELVHKALR